MNNSTTRRRSSDHPHHPASQDDHGTAAGQIRVVIADDHKLLREGLRRILSGSHEIVVSGEASDGHQALQLIERIRPEVAVVDLNMPGPSGMSLITRIRQACPGTAILVLTMHGEEQYAVRAFRAGANGYITKDSAADELVAAVRKVASGGAYLSNRMAERLALSLNLGYEAPRHSLLTDREFEVFRLIVSGLRLTDIAHKLHLSVKTISTHKSRILEKMELESTAALIRYGLQHQLFADAAAPDNNQMQRTSPADTEATVAAH